MPLEKWQFIIRNLVVPICGRAVSIIAHGRKINLAGSRSPIRQQTGIPWMVLHYIPPKTGSGVSGEGSEAAEILAAYEPTCFVSGHDHAFPYASGQSCSQRLGGVSALVPGQLLGASFPNYIKLDTKSGGLSWHAASDTWIPEDDHLVLKLDKV